MKKETPAGFIMRNSKGYPDFIMTMLVYFSLILFILLLIWLLAQYFGFRVSLQLAANKNHPFIDFIAGFNETMRLVVISISGSVFGLAGSYLLRRKFYDDHYLEKKKLEEQSGSMVIDSMGFVKAGESTLMHANYDDDEEEI